MTATGTAVDPTVSAAPSDTPPPAAGDQAGGPGRRRWDTTTLVAAVVCALLVGFAAAALVLRPTPPPGDTSPEAGFTRDMITHHAQAVDMGLVAFDRAAVPEIRQLGYDIATNQQGQIGIMHQWLREWGLSATRSEPPMAWMPDGAAALQDGLMPGMATGEQLAALYEAEGTEVDRLFLELMIQHHLGGIHMVDGVLDQSDHPDVTWLAGLMREGQQFEVNALRDLQRRFDLD